MIKKTKNVLSSIVLGLAVVGVLVGLWVYLANKEQETESGGLLPSLQRRADIIESYYDYDFTVDESLLERATFENVTRLYPQEEIAGVVRFAPPTEYFQVDISRDSLEDIVERRIVAATVRESGVTDELTPEYVNQLFATGTVEGSYDEVRELPDGRTKAEIAGEGCLVSASAYEKDKLRNFVLILFDECQNILSES